MTPVWTLAGDTEDLPVTKSAHDIGCAARQSKRCDCTTGRDRRIKRAALESLERRGNDIYEVPRGTLGDDDWLMMKLTGRIR